MSSQTPLSTSSSVVLTAVVAGDRLDIGAASKREPEALHEEFLKALRFIPFDSSDLTLIQLEQALRGSLASPRPKSPDGLASVTTACRDGTFDKTFWETQIYQHGKMHLSNAFGRTLHDEAPGENNMSRTEARLVDYGGQQAATAFRLVGYPSSAKDADVVRAKYSEYGGILALAACAVAAMDNGKVIHLLKSLPGKHRENLVAFISTVTPHMDLTRIVNTLFITKPRPKQNPKRNRIGRAPRRLQKAARRQRNGSHDASDTSKSQQQKFTARDFYQSSRSHVDGNTTAPIEATPNGSVPAPGAFDPTLQQGIELVESADVASLAFSDPADDWALSVPIPPYGWPTGSPTIAYPPSAAETTDLDLF